MFRSFFPIIITPLLLLFLNEPSKAQYSKESKQQFDRAIQLTHDRLYQLAIPVWEQLQEKHPKHPGIDFYTGLALFHSQKRKLDAIPHFEEAVDSISLDHDPFLEERTAPVDLYFYLGRSYHQAYRFEEALKMYRTFRDTAPESLQESFDIGRRIENVKVAREQVRHPLPVKVENLGPQVNSPSLDHSPVPSSDGKLLFFTSRRLRGDSSNYKVREWGSGKRFEQIYISRKNERGEWGSPKPLKLFQEYKARPSVINEALRSGHSEFNHTATSMISKEDGELIIYRSSGNSGNLYRSERKEDSTKNGEDGNGWGKPQKMEKAINSSSFENHLAISGNEEHLFFVSTRKGGHGGKDLYGMRKLPNGEWSKVYNLGDKINTALDEDGPVLHPNDKVLYFSSQGHSSMGGFDIFASKLQPDGTWGEPRNVGYPINTPDDDVYFMTSDDARIGYYSADYKNLKRNVAAVPGHGHEDLHKVSFPGQTREATTFLQGWIDTSSSCVEQGSIELIALSSNGDTLQHLSPRIKDRAYQFHLPSGASYELHYRFQGKSLRSEKIEVPERTAYSKLKRSLPLDTLQLQQNGTGCKLKDDPIEPTKALRRARRSKRGPIGLYEVTTGDIDRGKKATPAGRDTVRIIERDTIQLRSEKEVASQEEKGRAPKPQGELLYEARFGYNRTAPPRQEKDWSSLLDTVATELRGGEEVALRIQGSASKVPTSSYPSNLILAGHRAEALKNALLEALRKEGIPLESFRVEDIAVQVQGPDYKGDASNKERYAPFQYVRVWMRTSGGNP